MRTTEWNLSRHFINNIRMRWARLWLTILLLAAVWLQGWKEISWMNINFHLFSWLWWEKNRISFRGGSEECETLRDPYFSSLLNFFLPLQSFIDARRKIQYIQDSNPRKIGTSRRVIINNWSISVEGDFTLDFLWKMIQNKKSWKCFEGDSFFSCTFYINSQ